MQTVIRCLLSACACMSAALLVGCSNVSANQAYLTHAQSIPVMNTKRIHGATTDYRVSATSPQANTQPPSLIPPGSHF